MRKTAVAIAALFFANGAAFASWAPRIPELADRIDVDLAGLGLTLVMGGVGGLVGTAPAGRLIDRLGSRRVAIGGALGVSAMAAAIGFAPTPVVLGAALFLTGFSDISADLGMNAQAVQVEISGKSAMNRYHGLWSIGTVMGGVVGAAAVGAGVSLEAHLLTVGVAMAAVAVVSNRHLTNQEPPAPAPALAESHEKPSSRRPMILLGLFGLGAAFLESPGVEWSATFVDEVFSSSPATAAMGFVGFTVGMTTARLLGDSVAARWGSARAFSGSLPVAALGWTTLVLAPVPAVAIAGFTIAGLGTGMIFPQLYASGGSGVLVSQGRGLSAMSFGARLGFLLVTPTVGLLGSAVGLRIALAAVATTTLVIVTLLSRASNRAAAAV